MKYFIGCSGFYYKEWKNLFYPQDMPAKNWFKFYCEHFNTLEINSSFYKRPRLSTLQKWYHDSPPGFLFSMKAPRFITHLKRMNVEEKDMNDFYELASEGFKEKLGCILFQLPPSFSFTVERLGLICNKLNPAFKNVVEFRHKSWWTKEVYDELKKHSISFCGHSYPGDLPAAAIVNHTIIYYRFHGVPVLYKSKYKKQDMLRVLEEIGKGRKQAFIYFNNTWGTAALENSRQLKSMIAAGGADKLC